MIKRNPDADRYGDGDVPEIDYKPYQDNKFEPHPQTRGENKTPKSGMPFSKADTVISRNSIDK